MTWFTKSLTPINLLTSEGVNTISGIRNSQCPMSKMVTKLKRINYIERFSINVTVLKIRFILL